MVSIEGPVMWGTIAYSEAFVSLPCLRREMSSRPMSRPAGLRRCAASGAIVRILEHATVTDQFRNLLRIDGKVFELAEADGKWPEFNPKRHRLPIGAVGTHCWDGYWCAYTLAGERLVLDEVYLGWCDACAGGSGPSLFDRKARRIRHNGALWARYAGLQHPVRFTGSVIIGCPPRRFGLIPAAYGYEQVEELVFRASCLVERADATAEMQRHRIAWEAWWQRPRDGEVEVNTLEEFTRARAVQRSYSSFFAARRRVALA